MIIGGGLVYGFLKFRRVGTGELPAGIIAVPETATAMVTLSTSPEQWQRLRQFGTPDTQTAFDQTLADWRDRWMTQRDLSFSKHIEPWIGPEASLVWLPTPPPTANNAPVSIDAAQQRLLLLPIADVEAAQTLGAVLPIPSEAAAVDYRGVTLSPLSATDASADQLWVGVLGTQLVLITEDIALARQAIDTFRGGKSLLDRTGYRSSFEHIQMSQPFGKVYVNVPAMIQQLAETAQPQLPAAVIQGFQDSGGITATVAIASQGIQVQATSWLAAGSDRPYPVTNIDPQLPQYLPKDTLVMASGSNFQQFWQDLEKQRTWGALTAFDAENLAQALQNTVGLTLETDLLPWLAGEFALAVVPPSARSSEAETVLPNPGLIALAQVSDRPKAEQTFRQLDQVVKNRYRFSILKEPVGRLERVKWVSPFQSVTLSRGWLADTIAFLTVGNETEDELVPQPRRSLATDSLFQLTTGSAPSPNNGHFYVNLQALSQENEVLFIPAVPPENRGPLRAIRALGVTATILDDEHLRYDLYVALARGNRPGPLPSGGVSRQAPDE